MRKPSSTDATTKLRQFFDSLAAAAESMAAERHDGAMPSGSRQSRAVFGYTVQVGLDGLKAERFGDMPPARRTAATAAPPAAPNGPAARAPIVDMFEDDGWICIVAELPGVDGAEVQCTLQGPCLVIETAGAHVYRKSITLTRPVEPASLTRACRNGILEVRLRVAA